MRPFAWAQAHVPGFGRECGYATVRVRVHTPTRIVGISFLQSIARDSGRCVPNPKPISNLFRVVELDIFQQKLHSLWQRQFGKRNYSFRSFIYWPVTSAPGLRRLHRDGTALPHGPDYRRLTQCTGLPTSPPRRGTNVTARNILARRGIPGLATSALGLHWDWNLPAASASGLGSPPPHLHRDWAHLDIGKYCGGVVRLTLLKLV